MLLAKSCRSPFLQGICSPLRKLMRTKNASGFDHPKKEKKHPPIRSEQKKNIKNSAARLVMVVLLVCLQVWFLVYLIQNQTERINWAESLFPYLTLVVLLFIYTRPINSAYRMTWMLIIVAFPLLGVILYYLLSPYNFFLRRMRRRFRMSEKDFGSMLQQDPLALQHLAKEREGLAGESRYLWKTVGYPVYENTEVRYYPDPTLALQDMKKALREAQRFIFMEYYAIEDGKAFEGLLEILEEKVREGVEVRLFYDDIGSIFFLSQDFVRRMREKGIQCHVFNGVAPSLNLFMNHRDHRKITVVDGRVAFTGGYNLADEYFHLTRPYGFWKDTGVRLTGEAAKSFTVMFLRLWSVMEHPVKNSSFEIEEGLHRFFPKKVAGTVAETAAGAGNDCGKYNRDENSGHDSNCHKPDSGDWNGHVGGGGNRKNNGMDSENSCGNSNRCGYVQPYADSPLDDETTGEDVYMNILKNARDYCWFVTPYLILDDEMLRELTTCAKRGVDVRILTPHIPDKKIVFFLTRSYYRPLIEGGVKIYEYTPGFCHAKMCISDDCTSTVGTINMDFRSLYLHFEDGVLFHQSPAILDVKKDFDQMFSESEEVTEKYRGKPSIPVRLLQTFLRIVAPIM